MSNVVSLFAAKQLRENHSQEQSYQLRVDSMGKLELLEEMVRFQEERTDRGQLTLSMILRGRILFSALEHSAETQELRMLTKSYRRHLEHELVAFRENPSYAGALADKEPSLVQVATVEGEQ